MGIDEPLSEHSCATEWGAGMKWPTNTRLRSAMASRANSITWNSQNFSQYSSPDYTPVAFCPVVYSSSAHGIAMTVNTNLCRARGWNYWEVADWYPKLLVVKKN